jgi:hypothetical protein
MLDRHLKNEESSLLLKHKTLELEAQRLALIKAIFIWIGIILGFIMMLGACAAFFLLYHNGH